MAAEYLILREDIQTPLKRPTMSDAEYRDLFRTWRRILSDEQLMKHDLLRLQTLGTLGLDLNLRGIGAQRAIDGIIKDPSQISEGVYQRLSRSLGLENPASKCREYSDAANAVIDTVAEKLTYQDGVNIEMVNEIRDYSDPTTLLVTALDGRWHPKAQFEARRKLLLVNLAASIDQRKRTIHIEDQFRNFQGWLNAEFWNPQALLAESTGTFIISDHDPNTWACASASIISEEEGAGLELKPYQKKTHILQRGFVPKGGKPIYAFASVREKSLPLATLKMLRKGEEDPAITVDDDTGFMVVVKDKKDARAFVNHLMVKGYTTGYPMRVEDVSYTLDGERYMGKGASSPKVRMMKFFVRLADEMRVEVIMHTPETYAEHLYARGLCHAEYEINRLFDSEVNVPNLLFPPKYFPNFRPEKGRVEKIEQIRYEIERGSLDA